VSNDRENDIFVALYLEVEAPALCYSALLHIECFAVFLGVQGEMAEIGE
jgi:hypothetical protein